MATYKFIFTPEVQEFHDDLLKRKNNGDKSAKTMYDKLIYCMARVEIQGTRAGNKIIKDLQGKENDNLYELLSFDERIFCCMWDGANFVLLSHYTKDANQTDSLELAKARRLRDKWMRENPVKKVDEKKGKGKRR